MSLICVTEQAICENAVYQNAQQDPTLDRRLGVLTCAMIAVPLRFRDAIHGGVSCVRLKAGRRLGAGTTAILRQLIWRWSLTPFGKWSVSSRTDERVDQPRASGGTRWRGAMVTESASPFSTRELKSPTPISSDSAFTMILCRTRTVDIREGNGEDMYGHGTAVSGIIWRLAPKAEIGSFRVLGSSLSARTAQVSVAARKSIALGYQHPQLQLRLRNFRAPCRSTRNGPTARCCPAFMLSPLPEVRRLRNGPPTFQASLASIALFQTMEGFAICLGAWSNLPRRRPRCVFRGSNGGHRVMTGSSFAAAWLSGMLARLLSVYPDIDPILAKSLLRRVAARGKMRLATAQDLTPETLQACAALLICSASHASHAGWSRSSSQSSIRFSSSSSPESNATTSLSTCAGGRADWRPCTSPSASSRNRKRISNSAGMYSLRFRSRVCKEIVMAFGCVFALC